WRNKPYLLTSCAYFWNGRTGSASLNISLMTIIPPSVDKDNKPNIFLFLDYREFIKDFCKHQKTIDRSFSVRTFSGKISPTLFTSGLLYAILKRKRNM